MFDFLNKLFEWLFQFIPQFGLVGPHEKGVRVTCVPYIYKGCKVMDFGWYMYFPLFQEMYTLVVKPQILMVEVAREDNCGKMVVSTWAVQYWVRDIYKTMFEVEDHEERLASHTANIIGKCIEHGTEPGDDSLTEIRSAMSGFGLWIQGVFKLQYGHVRPHKLYLENVGTHYGRIVGGGGMD